MLLEILTGLLAGAEPARQVTILQNTRNVVQESAGIVREDSVKCRKKKCRKPRKTTKPHTYTHTHTQRLKHIRLPSTHDRSDHDASLLVHALNSQKMDAAQIRTLQAT